MRSNPSRVCVARNWSEVRQTELTERQDKTTWTKLSHQKPLTNLRTCVLRRTPEQGSDICATWSKLQSGQAASISSVSETVSEMQCVTNRFKLTIGIHYLNGASNPRMVVECAQHTRVLNCVGKPNFSRAELARVSAPSGIEFTSRWQVRGILTG